MNIYPDFFIGITKRHALQYKLIYFYTVNEWEFYDLKNDPGEKQNLITYSKYKKEIDRMKKRLNEVRREYDDKEAAGILKAE